MSLTAAQLRALSAAAAADCRAMQRGPGGRYHAFGRGGLIESHAPDTVRRLVDRGLMRHWGSTRLVVTITDLGLQRLEEEIG